MPPSSTRKAGVESADIKLRARISSSGLCVTDDTLDSWDRHSREGRSSWCRGSETSTFDPQQGQLRDVDHFESSLWVAHRIAFRSPMEASTKPQADATAPLEPAKEPSPMYRTAMALCKPVALWGRLQAEGLEALPESCPVLVVGNHDSHWDPLMVGISAIRRRQIKALAKAELWDVRGLAPILNGMGQIPIERD